MIDRAANFGNGSKSEFVPLRRNPSLTCRSAVSGWLWGVFHSHLLSCPSGMETIICESNSQWFGRHLHAMHVSAGVAGATASRLFELLQLKAPNRSVRASIHLWSIFHQALLWTRSLPRGWSSRTVINGRGYFRETKVFGRNWGHILKSVTFFNIFWWK